MYSREELEKAIQRAIEITRMEEQELNTAKLQDDIPEVTAKTDEHGYSFHYSTCHEPPKIDDAAHYHLISASPDLPEQDNLGLHPYLIPTRPKQITERKRGERINLRTESSDAAGIEQTHEIDTEAEMVNDSYKDHQEKIDPKIRAGYCKPLSDYFPTLLFKVFFYQALDELCASFLYPSDTNLLSRRYNWRCPNTR
jgi:hypothetical protein